MPPQRAKGLDRASGAPFHCAVSRGSPTPLAESDKITSFGIAMARRSRAMNSSVVMTGTAARSDVRLKKVASD
eukprot:6980023-Prymnesium_polylepis.1